MQPGDYATFASTFELLGEEPNQTVKGRAFDDRAGCAVLCELLSHDYGFDLAAVFTTQEEVGLRGAIASAFSVAPDIGIVLEGTICDDLPKKRDVSPVTEVGKGPGKQTVILPASAVEAMGDAFKLFRGARP